MKIYFISDTHLKASSITKKDRKRQERVVNFLDSINGKADVLVMAGDIFDIWYDWKAVVLKEFFPVYNALSRLKKSNCRLIFVCGNHDFYLNGFLEKFIGIEVYRQNFLESIDGKKIFVSHGDSYTQNDFRYKLYKLIIRSGGFRVFFGLLHPDFAIKIGSLASRISRGDKKVLDKKEKGLLNFAKMKIEQEKCDLVVMGHTHNPVFCKLGKSVYCNTGTWINCNTYLEIIDGKMKLCRKELSKN